MIKDTLRKDFPLLKSGLIYLDNSATSQKPTEVIEAVKKYYENDLIICQNINPNIFKKINEDNIKKIGIKPIDLFLLPKNKKLYLINLIEEIFEDFQLKVVYDKIRLNPFYEDSLYIFIKEHQEQFSKNIIETYKKRNKDVNYLLEEASIQHQIYETCFLLSRKNKIIDYWINIWGGTTNYKDSTLIEHLIIK